MKSVHQVAYEILRTHGMTTVFGNPQRRDQGTLHAKFAVSFVLPTPV